MKIPICRFLEGYIVNIWFSSRCFWEMMESLRDANCLKVFMSKSYVSEVLVGLKTSSFIFSFPPILLPSNYMSSFVLLHMFEMMSFLMTNLKRQGQPIMCWSLQKHELKYNFSLSVYRKPEIRKRNVVFFLLYEFETLAMFFKLDYP